MKVIPVDFGNADKDGAVRLITRDATNYCREHEIVLLDGLFVHISDGELLAEGILTKRDGFWIVKVDKWLRV